MTQDGDSFISSLRQAVRDNPLAAALIGGGALWLMVGNRAIGVTSAAQAEAGRRGVLNAAEAVKNTGDRAANVATDAARSMTRAAGEAASGSASAVKDRMEDTIGGTTDALNRTIDTLRSTPNPLPHLQKGYASAESAATDLFERQPLVLGAIGLAIGAGVASAVASTAFENKWAGPPSDGVKDAVKHRAERVAETAGHAAGEAGSEFRAAAGGAVDKLRKTGEDAAQSVSETVDAGRA